MGGCASVSTKFKKGEAPAEAEEQVAPAVKTVEAKEVKEENPSLGTLLKEGEGEGEGEEKVVEEVKEAVEEEKKETVEEEDKKET